MKFFTLFDNILVNILFGILRRVIPLQLLHFVRSTFFGILTIIPYFYSAGKFSSVHIFTKIGCNKSVVFSISAFKISGAILSTPGALPSLISSSAIFTSEHVGGDIFIVESSSMVSFPYISSAFWFSL
ncbi:hypothetical protein XELAEV_18027289mg [Xenopus laevis]|uniref:Uncharacterized protein n=1 Tax=Xenopus laevis TaxID=8355 RepID=A0A974HJI1_XENLA|nr:hypothetical protein XELAEV_18027289mg [Xenopus laevis]